jgi:hypothetical protein
VIDPAGRLCLSDAGGPCANAVKDAQRTKTGLDTLRTQTLVVSCYRCTAGRLSHSSSDQT